MRPNPISLETAQLLSAKLKMPIEHIMHMPPHILTQKLAELAGKESASESNNTNKSE
jgi:tRNA A37 threonylcarbamoyltransferase TsaD